MALSSRTERAPVAAARPPKWRIWMLAARPQTLPAAIVPVLVGTAAAYAGGAWRPAAAAAALVSALFLQIGTNIANDLFDFQRGADTAERTGPVRVTQAGLLTPAEVRRGMWLSFALAFAVGLYLVYVGGWPILAIGLASIACGLWYTAGPYPLAYHGLGDVFAFVFFGIVAVNGTYFVHTGSLAPVAFWASLPVAALVTAILVVNNYRDLETDRRANKRTLAVRLGRRATQVQYLLLLVTAYLVPAYLWLVQGYAWGWLPLCSAPLAARLWSRFVAGHGAALNPVLKGTGKLHLVHGVLIALSFVAGAPRG